MSTLLISAAGAGDQSAVGTPELANVAQGILYAGVGETFTDGKNNVVSFDVDGRNVAFDFVENHVPAPIHVSFYFGDGIVVPAVSAGDQGAIGSATVENAAQGISPQGIPAGEVPRSHVVYDGALNGGGVDFDFTEFYNQSGLNVAFYFGGDIVLFNVSAGDQSAFGNIEDIDQALTIRPQGIPPGEVNGGRTIVYWAGPNGVVAVDFDFVEDWQQYPATSIRFDFGDDLRPITQAGGIDSLQMGAPTVENVAQGAFQQGWDSFSPGPRHFVYEEIGVRQGARLDFNFVQGYEPPTALNVPFQFINASGFGPIGFVATAFGNTVIETDADTVAPVGFDALLFGDHSVAGVGPDRTITPAGFVATLFGTHLATYTQTVNGIGYDAARYGTAFVENNQRFVYPQGFNAALYGAPTIIADQVVEPFGIPPTVAFGLPRIRDKAELLQTITGAGNINGIRWGTPRVELFNRQLLVVGYNAARYGTAKVTPGIQEIKPTGFTRANKFGTLRIAFRVRYLDAIGFDAARYGETAIYNFDPTQYIAPLGVPAGDAGTPRVENYIRYVYPVGKESSTFVSRFLSVTNYDREVYPFGLPPGPVGTPALEERIQYPIAPLGGDYSQYGTPTVYNLRQIILPPGFEGIVSEYAEVYFDERNRIRPAGLLQTAFGGNTSVRLGQFFVDLLDDGIAGLKMGTPRVSLAVQRVTVAGFDAAKYSTATTLQSTIQPPIEVPAILPKGFGTAFIAYRVRYLGVVSFKRDVYGTPVIGFDRAIEPVGYDASAFGLANVLDNTLRVRPPGIAPGLVSPVDVSNYVRTIRPFTLGVQTQFPRGGLELHRVRNNWQFVAPFTDAANTWGPYFGNFNLVENRDRTIQTYGVDTAKVPAGLVVANKAIPLFPRPITGEFGIPMVAERVRYVYPESVDEFPPISRYNVVYNDARIVGPFGVRTDSYGTPDVRNINRTLGQFFPYVGPETGLPFVAYRIRELRVLFGIPAEPVPTPVVYNLQRFIRPTGIAKGDQTGAHAVEERFTKFAPRWILQTKYGNPFVYNVTPELGQQGRDSAEFGQAFVRLEYRFVEPAGTVTALFGRPDITRGIRFVQPLSFTAFRSDRFTRVENGDPGLPVPQTIQARSVPLNDDQLEDLIGRPALYKNEIEPDGVRHTTYGTPTVVSNGISPKGILLLADDAFGTPTVNKPFLIDLDNRGIPPGTVPKHRVTPHTIWARFDAPQQAIQNHGNETWQFMDYDGPGDTGRRPFFGRPRVTNQNRTITVTQPYPTGRPNKLGVPSLSLRMRFVRPEGIRPFRYGVPRLLGGNLGLTVFSPDDFAEYGRPTVARYVPPNVTQFISVQGTLAYRTGASRIENKNRRIEVNGFNAGVVQRPTEVSRSPRFVEVQGHDATSYGETWVSNYIRYIEIEGLDQLEMDFGLGSFRDRMRVKQRTFITAPGDFTPLAFGTATLGSSTRSVVQTDEIAGGAVGVPACFTRNIVALGGYGFEATTFGDVDRWEAGKAKAAGLDALRCGVPTLNRVINVTGLEGSLGTPAIGRGVYPAGIDSFQAGVPSTPLVNPHGCGSTARAVAPWVFVQGGVGTPTVAQ